MKNIRKKKGLHRNKINTFKNIVLYMQFFSTVKEII